MSSNKKLDQKLIDVQLQEYMKYHLQRKIELALMERMGWATNLKEYIICKRARTRQDSFGGTVEK